MKIELGPDVDNELRSVFDETRRSFVVVGGRLRARGRYRIGHQLAIVAIAGQALVDLSESTFPPDGTRLRVVALGAQVDVLLPPGVPWTLQRHVVGRARVEVGAQIHRLPAWPESAN